MTAVVFNGCRACKIITEREIIMKEYQSNFTAPDPRAVKSYLRFSYPAETDGLFTGESRTVSAPCFDSGAERKKEEYFEELCRILDRILESERRNSDAAFLSSGVDSSLIAFGIRAKKTFSVAYEEDDFNESELARQSAAALNSEHHIVKISPSDFFGAVDAAMASREHPTGDASYIALFIAAKEVSRYTDIICSGEGPDELFCGYPCYSRFFDKPCKDFWLQVNTIMDIGEIPSFPDYGGDGFLKMNAFDLTYWTYGNIIPNIIAAAKGAGITIRMPYMDPELKSFALSLPIKYKADRTMGKLLFREAALRYVGSEIAFREKRGFPVPVRKWMRLEPFQTDILDTLTGSTAKTALAFIDTNKIAESYYSDSDDALWKQIWELYVYIKWYKTIINRSGPDTFFA